MNEILLKIQERTGNILFADQKGTLIGKYEKLWDIYPFPETIRAFEEAKKRGNSFFEAEVRGKFLRIKIFRIERNLYLVQVEDVSCEKTLEKKKKEIVSTISHEIKTPLTVIKGNAEYLLYYGNVEEKEIVEEILERVSKALSILSGLNKLISTEKRFREHNLRELILSSIKGLREVAQKKGLNLTLKLEDIVVPCERVLVEQMVRNLVDNAIKFTNKGYVNISLKKVEKEAILEVEDTGRGIEEELKPLIFEKYVKAVDSSGQGIGLSVVKEIVNYHGWKIEFKSEKQKGTKFLIRIPLS
ncbi:MAG: HAMP domain-containing sensor histidine kinase [Desulfurobacteriaceae bacterium]